MYVQRASISRDHLARPTHRRQHVTCQVFQIPELSIDPVLVDKVKRFLGFDSFFEIVPSPAETDENQNAAAIAAIADDDSASELADVVAPQILATDVETEEINILEVRHGRNVR